MSLSSLVVIFSLVSVVLVGIMRVMNTINESSSPAQTITPRTEATTSSQTCPTGQATGSLDKNGNIMCLIPSEGTVKSCQADEVITGVDFTNQRIQCTKVGFKSGAVRKTTSAKY